MNRFMYMLLCAFSIFMTVETLPARSIDPKGDSLAVAQMRERMEQIRQHRPTVALVLSGGGAKGAAHVGAIRYM